LINNVVCPVPISSNRSNRSKVTGSFPKYILWTSARLIPEPTVGCVSHLQANPLRK